MTREQLIDVIDTSDEAYTCKSPCPYIDNENLNCRECAEIELRKYEKEIISKTVDKFVNYFINIDPCDSRSFTLELIKHVGERIKKGN